MSRPRPEEVEDLLRETYDRDSDYYAEEGEIEMGKWYSINRCAGDGAVIAHVHVDSHRGGTTVCELPLRLDLWNHSPTGFNYGYAGSGPAQLALALLADALGDDGQAIALHQEFKFATVARWKEDCIEISVGTIKSIAADLAASPAFPATAEGELQRQAAFAATLARESEDWERCGEPSDDPPPGAHVENCRTVTLEELDRLFEEE